MRCRKGKQAADREFGPLEKGVVTTYFLQRVEVDHTKLPSGLKVVDDRTGEELGTVTVTVAYDHFTRMPHALLVHFEGETIGVVFCCLRMVMTPKDFLKKLVPNLDYQYPCGVPSSYFFDRAAASNTAHVQRVGAVLEIRIDYAVGECPNMKGSIERFIRLIKEEVSQPIVGPKPKSFREELASASIEVSIKYSVLVRRLWTWATVVYAKSWHGGISDVPLRRYQQSVAGRLPRALRKKDDLVRRLECPSARHNRGKP
jgi:putative transposase